MTTDVRQLADPVWALIDAITGVDTFDGDDPTPTFDPDGGVHAYAVYYPGPGWAHALLACGGTDSLDWTFQVTCVGADRTRALWCVNKVRAALTGKTLTVDGQKLQIRETPGPDRLMRDDDVQPSRRYSPLIFAVNA